MIALYFIGCIAWILAMVLLVACRFYERVLGKYDVIPKDINLFYRPWGLKNKELVEIIKTTDIEDVRKNLTKALMLRRYGFRLLLVLPLFIVLDFLFRILMIMIN